MASISFGAKKYNIDSMKVRAEPGPRATDIAITLVGKDAERLAHAILHETHAATPKGVRPAEYTRDSKTNRVDIFLNVFEHEALSSVLSRILKQFDRDVHQNAIAKNAMVESGSIQRLRQ